MIGRCEDAYADAVRARAARSACRTTVDEIGWLLEELRVSLFAQNLRTKVPVSEKRAMLPSAKPVVASVADPRSCVPGRLHSPAG